MDHFLSLRRRGVFGIALILVALGARPAPAQPYNLNTGVGDGSVTVGVDGYGAMGINGTMPDSTGGSFDPIGAPGVIAATIWESGVALRIGAVGPRAFLTSGTIGGSGGLPKATVTGTATTGNSTFLDPSGQLSFSLVQTIAPSFNGALRTGSVLTQTYTVTNTTAASLTFELCRLVDTERNFRVGGQFFAADGTEILYDDENPVNPLVMGISAIGGTPLAANRFEIKANPAVRTDILTGLPLNDAVVGGPPFNVNMGFRNVFTVAAGASVVYTTHTIWGNGPAANVIFPNGPPPTTPAPGVLYASTWTGNQLLTINTTPTTGRAAATLVGPLPAGVVPAGLSFRGNALYVYDQLGDRLRQVDPASGANLAIIDPSVSGVFGEGDIAFRSDGIGFIAPGAPAQLYRVDITGPTSTLITGALSPVIDGFAFSSANVMYGLSEGGGGLYTINQTTGATTLVGNTGIAGTFTVGGLAFDSSGNLFAAVGSPTASFLYQINPATGSAALLGNIGFTEVSGLSFMSGLIPPPPGGGGGGGGGGGPGEGSHPGIGGLGGGSGEGSYGFGGGGFGFGGIPPARAPILQGPLHVDGTRFRVWNVSHRLTNSESEPGTTGGIGMAAWALFVGAALMLLSILVVKK